MVDDRIIPTFAGKKTCFSTFRSAPACTSQHPGICVPPLLAMTRLTGNVAMKNPRKTIGKVGKP